MLASTGVPHVATTRERSLRDGADDRTATSLLVFLAEVREENHPRLGRGRGGIRSVGARDLSPRDDGGCGRHDEERRNNSQLGSRNLPFR